MNFAEQLINWRNNNQELQKCQQAINNQIDAKVTFVVDQLKRNTKNEEISICTLNTLNFFSTLSDIAKYRYRRECSNSIFMQLLINAFSSKENIIPITGNIDENTLYIFYNNGGNSAQKLVETWFNSYVLKDFEEEYKRANTEAARFTSFYEAEYTYYPIIKFMDRLVIGYEPATIQAQIQKLAEDNGLYISRTVYPKFTLQIQ